MFKKYQGGFSIIEVIMVLGLVGLVVGFGASGYQVWQKNIHLNNVRDEIKSSLFRAQQLATAAAKSNPWGVHLEVDSYTIFKGNFYNEDDPDNMSWQLEGVEILEPYRSFDDGAGSTTADVLFGKFDGQTINTGIISLSPIADPALIKTIEVEAPGQIN
ncbi:hypothetical protein KKH39_01980 [Patescibacteria group bacterium]|nr:hypothetical protein [Patescibacteria group bacterium]